MNAERQEPSSEPVDPAEIATGEWPGVDNPTYHGDLRYDSHSTLEVFRRSVKKYHAYYIARTVERPAATADMDFGTAFHAALLEPDRFHKAVAVSTFEFKRRSNADKERTDIFIAEARKARMVPIEPEQFDQIQKMVHAVRSDPEAARILALADGRRERSVRWIDPDTGLPMKARMDWIATDWNMLPRGIILDVKSSHDVHPDLFAKSIANYGYHRQAALYIDGMKESVQLGCDFVFLAVSKDEPYDCALHQLSGPDEELGRLQNRRTLARLADCKQRDCWTSPWYGRRTTIELPRWAHYEK